MVILFGTLACGGLSCSQETQEFKLSPIKETPISSPTNFQSSIQTDTPVPSEPRIEPCGDGVCEGSENTQDCPEDCAETPTLQEELKEPSSTPNPETGTEDQIPQVVQAKEDLAQRLGINTSEIKLLKFEAVTWPNASLGCPQPGMAYAEVLTPGYLLILSVKGIEYEYHASRGGEVIYCSNPEDPVPGTPIDF